MSVTFWVNFSRRYATRLAAIISGDKSPGYVRLPLTRPFLRPARGCPRSTAKAADRNEPEGRMCHLYDFCVAVTLPAVLAIAAPAAHLILPRTPFVDVSR